MKDIKILSIETSCDETAAAVVKNGREVLSNVVYTQMELHALYGGVVPEVASRKHVEKINIVIESALKEANLTYDDIDAIAVTYGPGLVGALLVGVAAAKALAYALNKPLIAVNHMEGHIAANYITNEEFKPPFVCLVVSGGHTHLVEVDGYTEYKIKGSTRDDAIGEAYDKVARVLGLGYPGGPKIDKMSKGIKPTIDFPRSFLHEANYDFSFSGIKSAVLNYVNSKKMKEEDLDVVDIAASFQKAAVEVLVKKTIRLAKDKNIHKVAVAGGVSANTYLRDEMKKACDENEISLQFPEFKYCTDNAAMIGAAAYYDYLDNQFARLDLNAVPNLKLGDNRQ